MVLKAVNGYGLGDWFMGILPGTNYCREVHQHRTVDNVARRVETRFSYAGPFATVTIMDALSAAVDARIRPKKRFEGLWTPDHTSRASGCDSSLRYGA